MAARSIRLTIRNRSDSQFVLSGASLDHGIWSPGGPRSRARCCWRPTRWCWPASPRG
ncbi:hypothetical protein [Teichococcus aestuarii]|uniref:hypothetical protein n=1 Tax=Teichococcus aestuarii TaxID=568898 RepID=UPI00361E2ECC